MNQTDDVTDVVADVGAQRVARVYAEALLNTAQKHQQAQEIQDDLEALVRDVFARDPHFETFLASRAIGREAKAAVIHKAFDGRSNDLFVNFLIVLNNHDRLDLLRPIQVAYRELFDDRAHRIRVHVRSAVPLQDDQQERLRNELRQAFQREPILETAIDPDLLGGMVVLVGDWVYDASVRTRLANLKNDLIERSSHEIQSRRDRFSSADGN
jgi:F-type H+-transporting ATPase subunit delta